jgi:molybdate transport system ATP-binding protein
MAPTTVLLEFRDVSLRFGQTVTLSHIDWQLQANQHWGVVGDNGAGKTSFLSLVRGDIWPSPEGGLRLYRANGRPQTSPIGFRELTGLVSCDLLERYRQNRWNISGLDVVCTGFRGTAYLYDRPSRDQVDQSEKLLTLLGMEDLAGRPVLSMSLGQARKILIARALVHQPKVLLVDEVCAGLDTVSSKTVLELLRRAVEAGTQIIYATHDQTELPRFITHVLALKSGRVERQGPVEHTSPQAATKRNFDFRPLSTGDRKQTTRDTGAESLLCLENAQVWAGGKRILHNLNWTVQRGENWAVLGRNGSGKTTLLSVISGEIRPAWGGVIRRFGREDPQTIGEIRRRIGFVSPDLQSSHVRDQSAMELVLSGFYGSIGLHVEPTPHQLATALSWFEALHVDRLRDCDVRALSYGQIRILVILRSMVARPDILLLDEPLSGLDAKASSAVLAVIDSLADSGIVCVYVTHDSGALPYSISHVAVMDAGRLVFQGTREAWNEAFGSDL